MNKHQTAVAAEAFAAGVFAQAGYSVFVQYGANQPGYDLVVSNGGGTIHVSVKGSADGWWVLAVKDSNGTYQQALEEWTARNSTFVFCLVQFDSVKAGDMPRMYLATGREIAEELRTHWFGEVSLSLAEHRAPTRGKNQGRTMTIPPSWRMTEERIREVVQQNAEPRDQGRPAGSPNAKPAPQGQTRERCHPADVRKELEALGFSRAGSICPLDGGKSCRADLAAEVPGYVVYALVVGDQIKKFGKTRTGIKNRLGGTANALAGVLRDPTKPRNDPFKRLAPRIVEANQEIEVWAKESAVETYTQEEVELNLKYTPEWFGRPD